ncbi:M23 family metallopeptidase, partial [Leptospira kemamanensis]
DKDTLTELKNKYPMGDKNKSAIPTRPLSISEHIWGSFDDPGQPIKGLNLSESRASILDRFPERELSEIYILKDRSKAEEYIKNGNYDEQTKKKLTTELDRMQNEWRENEKTEEGRIKNRNVEAAFKGYDVIQYEGRLPVYRNQNGAILPFPIINSDFGPRDVTDSGVHNGLDFPVPIGTPVPVVYSGTVIKSNYSESWGNYVVVKSEDGYNVYAYRSSSDVKVGDQVNQGSQLGRSGNSGFFIKDGVSQQVGAHFHFGVFIDENLKKPVDPKGSE